MGRPGVHTNSHSKSNTESKRPALSSVRQPTSWIVRNRKGPALSSERQPTSWIVKNRKGDYKCRSCILTPHSKLPLYNFYSTTFVKKIMYFLLHTFSLPPKSTSYIVTGKCSKSDTLSNRTSLVIPTASELADSPNTNDLFVNYVWVLECAPGYLSIKKIKNGSVWFA